MVRRLGFTRTTKSNNAVGSTSRKFAIIASGCLFVATIFVYLLSRFSPDSNPPNARLNDTTPRITNPRKSSNKQKRRVHRSLDNASSIPNTKQIAGDRLWDEITTQYTRESIICPLESGTLSHDPELDIDYFSHLSPASANPHNSLRPPGYQCPINLHNIEEANSETLLNVLDYFVDIGAMMHDPNGEVITVGENYLSHTIGLFYSKGAGSGLQVYPRDCMLASASVGEVVARIVRRLLDEVLDSDDPYAAFNVLLDDTNEWFVPMTYEIFLQDFFKRELNTSHFRSILDAIPDNHYSMFFRRLELYIEANPHREAFVRVVVDLNIQDNGDETITQGLQSALR